MPGKKVDYYMEHVSYTIKSRSKINFLKILTVFMFIFNKKINFKI